MAAENNDRGEPENNPIERVATAHLDNSSSRFVEEFHNEQARVQGSPAETNSASSASAKTQPDDNSRHGFNTIDLKNGQGEQYKELAGSAAEKRDLKKEPEGDAHVGEHKNTGLSILLSALRPELKARAENDINGKNAELESQHPQNNLEQLKVFQNENQTRKTANEFLTDLQITNNSSSLPGFGKEKPDSNIFSQPPDLGQYQASATELVELDKSRAPGTPPPSSIVPPVADAQPYPAASISQTAQHATVDKSLGGERYGPFGTGNGIPDEGTGGKRPDGVVGDMGAGGEAAHIPVLMTGGLPGEKLPASGKQAPSIHEPSRDPAPSRQITNNGNPTFVIKETNGSFGEHEAKTRIESVYTQTPSISSTVKYSNEQQKLPGRDEERQVKKEKDLQNERAKLEAEQKRTKEQADFAEGKLAPEKKAAIELSEQNLLKLEKPPSREDLAQGALGNESNKSEVHDNAKDLELNADTRTAEQLHINTKNEEAGLLQERLRSNEMQHASNDRTIFTEQSKKQSSDRAKSEELRAAENQEQALPNTHALNNALTLIALNTSQKNIQNAELSELSSLARNAGNSSGKTIRDGASQNAVAQSRTTGQAALKAEFVSSGALAKKAISSELEPAKAEQARSLSQLAKAAKSAQSATNELFFGTAAKPNLNAKSIVSSEINSKPLRAGNVSESSERGAARIVSEIVIPKTGQAAVPKQLDASLSAERSIRNNERPPVGIIPNIAAESNSLASKVFGKKWQNFENNKKQYKRCAENHSSGSDKDDITAAQDGRDGSSELPPISPSLIMAVFISICGMAKSKKQLGNYLEYLSEQAATANGGSLAGSRRTHVVESNDTLQSIAEKYFGDARIAWLIADLNCLAVISHDIEQQRIIELKCRQLIELPQAHEIKEFLSSLPSEFDINSLSTFVADTVVNIELMQQFFGHLLGAADVKGAGESETELPEKNKSAWTLPELTII